MRDASAFLLLASTLSASALQLGRCPTPSPRLAITPQRHATAAAAAHASRLPPPPRMMAQPAPAPPEEDGETLEALKVAGSFSLGCVALYSGLTAVGVDETLAGNLVLLSLCGVGAYLLFFDGGVTQAALQNQAVLQVAAEEGDIMDQAPREAFAPLAAAAAAASPPLEALAADGVVKLDGVLSAGTCAALLEHVNAELVLAVAAAQADLAADARLFGDVLMRSNRYDLKLDLDPPVRAALAEVVAAVRPAVAATLGPDAELFELAALVSDPKAPRQPVHPDTPYREDAGVAVLTSFVALQDIEEDMGPTFFVPRTQTAEAHAAFNSQEDGGRAKVALLREMPNRVGTLSKGDLTLFDSRLLHGGGANDSSKRRVLLYVSFRAPRARTPPGTLLYDLKVKGHTLADSDEWLGRAAA